MPRLGTTKESTKGGDPVGPGNYKVRFDGFEVKLSKKGDSHNLNPILKITGHPSLNDRRVYINLNTKAGWILVAFCHCFGLPMDDAGDDLNIPGEFKPNPADPDDTSKWMYTGPLTAKTGQLEIVEADNSKGGTKPAIKQFFCTVPNCQEKHPNNLL